MFKVLHECGIEICKRDIKSIFRSNNISLLNICIQYLDDGLMEKLYTTLLYDDNLNKEMYSIVDPKFGFMEYLDDELHISQIPGNDLSDMLEKVCRYGGIEDKRILIKSALDKKGCTKEVLDFLFLYGDISEYFADDYFNVKRSSRNVCKELLRLMK